ncbi:MAG: hypothetical protein KUG78_08550 [Kangiellaceae bacterium]|nr:hypothetical protein [Kangiellaceae bacterium]
MMVKFLNKYSELIVVVSVALLSVILLASMEQDLLTTVSLLLLLLIIGTTLYQFTRRLDEENLSVVFRLAYGFVVFTLVGAAYLLFVVSEPKFIGKIALNKNACDTSEEKQCKAKTPYSYAVGIFPGCDYTAERFKRKHVTGSDKAVEAGEIVAAEKKFKRRQTSGIPYESFCDTLAPQWVLSIGGSVSQCYIDGTCSKVRDENSKSKSELRIQLLVENRALKKLQDKLSRKRIIERKIKDQPPFYKREIGKLKSELAALFTTDTELMVNENIKAHSLTVAMLELEIQDYPEDAILAQSFSHPISGGIVVPIYFVVLAFLGALVGLMRRVPEYQRRSSTNYRETYDVSSVQERDQHNPPITPDQAREFLIFQILQVISAPIIAIVAFAWFDPSNKATSVVLAFAAGFSSEIFLLAVRKVTETVIGRGIPKYTSRTTYSSNQNKTNDIENILPINVAPRGPVNNTKPKASMASYVYKIGERIVLVKKLAMFLPGTQGTVVDIDSNNYVTVRTTKDHAGEVVEFTLLPQQSDYFKPYDQVTKTDEEGPVG